VQEVVDQPQGQSACTATSSSLRRRSASVRLRRTVRIIFRWYNLHCIFFPGQPHSMDHTGHEQIKDVRKTVSFRCCMLRPFKAI
jgi:hypothetical protein